MLANPVQKSRWDGSARGRQLWVKERVSIFSANKNIWKKSTSSPRKNSGKKRLKKARHKNVRKLLGSDQRVGRKGQREVSWGREGQKHVAHGSHAKGRSQGSGRWWLMQIHNHTISLSAIALSFIVPKIKHPSASALLFYCFCIVVRIRWFFVTVASQFIYFIFNSSTE